MNALALPLAVALLGVIGEILLLHFVKRETVPWRDTIFNLNSGHILMWLFRGVEVYCFGLVAAHFSLGWLERWPLWLQWGFAFFAWDCCFYWLHRLHHKIGLLWAVHVVHHQGEHFNLSLGIRNSWYSSLSSIPFFLPLAVLGLPLPVFVAISSLHYTVQLFNHSGLVGHMGWLERVLITPSHHRVHHGANPQYLDCNFGGTLQLWDRLFGTFRRRLPDVPIRYGVPGMALSHNPFWASNLPLLHWLGRPCPIDAPARLSHWRQVLVASGGIVLFGLVIYYVHYDGRWPQQWQALYFLLVFAGTLALGGLSDGRRWGVRLWLLVTVLLPLFSSRTGLVDGHAGPWLMLATVLQGMLSAVVLWREPAGERQP